MIQFLGFLLLVGPPIYLDLKERKIPVLFCLGFAVLAVVFNLVFSWVLLWEEIFGVIFGLSFFAVSYFSKEALGKGDAWLILAGSAWSGIFGALEITLIGLLLAGVFGIGYVLITKKGWKTKLPFAPFYGVAAIGWSVVLWMTNGG